MFASFSKGPANVSVTGNFSVSIAHSIGHLYCAILAESKNCGVTTASRYYAAAHKQQQQEWYFLRDLCRLLRT
jgi:hypothetical protein